MALRGFSYLWALLFLTLAGLSCGRRDSFSGFWGGVTQQPFSAWCSVGGVENCKVSSGGALPQKEWDSALELTAIVLDSSSTFEMSRTDFDNPHLQALFHVLGAKDVLGVLRSFPWNSLSFSVGRFDLRNEKSGVSVDVRGVKFRGTQAVNVRFDRKRILISGIDLIEPNAVRAVRALDLSKAGYVTMITDSLVIQDLPIEFFVSEGKFSQNLATQNDAAVGDVGELVKAISELALDESFGWREKLTILLTQSELPELNKILANFGPRDPVVDSVMNAVASSDQVLFGGERSENVLSVSRKTSLSCSFHVAGVPVVGNLNLSIVFASGFGMAGLTRGENGVLAKIDSYGIETNFGKVKSIEVKPDRMVLNVGLFHIPMAFNPKSDAKGPRVTDGSCIEN
jgi:hypothetical protein